MSECCSYLNSVNRCCLGSKLPNLTLVLLVQAHEWLWLPNWLRLCKLFGCLMFSECRVRKKLYMLLKNVINVFHLKLEQVNLYAYLTFWVVRGS